MRKGILILAVLILTIVSLFGLKAMVSNRLSTSGLELSKIQEETERYKTQNLLLSENVYSLSSLNYIALEASKVGFLESKSNFSVTAAVPLALRQ